MAELRLQTISFADWVDLVEAERARSGLPPYTTGELETLMAAYGTRPEAPAVSAETLTAVRRRWQGQEDGAA